MNLFQRFWQKRRLPCAAVIVAAGAGVRMHGMDKILSPVGGKPVIVHTIAAFEASGAIDEIIVVTRKEQQDTIRELIRENPRRLEALQPRGEAPSDPLPEFSQVAEF